MHLIINAQSYLLAIYQLPNFSIMESKEGTISVYHLIFYEPI